jgi:hypothetical protein
MRHVLALVLLAAALIPPPSARADTPTNPVIESISGADTVTIITERGKLEVGVGAPVRAGQWIKTGDRSAIRLLYPDGTTVVVGRATEYEVLAPSARAAEGAVLHEGYVRASVKQPAQRRDGAPKVRFLIRARSAVMGVRGTEFVAQSVPGSEVTVLHTLTGAVDIARNERQLLAGKGVPVKANFFSQAAAGAIEPPRAFNPGEFLRQTGALQPEATQLARQPLQSRAQVEQLRREVTAGSSPSIFVTATKSPLPIPSISPIAGKVEVQAAEQTATRTLGIRSSRALVYTSPSPSPSPNFQVSGQTSGAFIQTAQPATSVLDPKQLQPQPNPTGTRLPGAMIQSAFQSVQDLVTQDPKKDLARPDSVNLLNQTGATTTTTTTDPFAPVIKDTKDQQQTIEQQTNTFIAPPTKEFKPPIDTTSPATTTVDPGTSDPPASTASQSQTFQNAVQQLQLQKDAASTTQLPTLSPVKKNR